MFNLNKVLLELHLLLCVSCMGRKESELCVSVYLTGKSYSNTHLIGFIF